MRYLSHILALSALMDPEGHYLDKLDEKHPKQFPVSDKIKKQFYKKEKKAHE